MSILRSSYRILNRLWLCLIAPLTLVLSGCGAEDQPDSIVAIENGAEYIISFDITVNSLPNVSTRAPEGDYEPGTGWENYINVTGMDYRILFFSHNPDVTNSDFLLGSLNNMEISLLADSSVNKTYKVTGKIRSDVAKMLMSNIVKIVVLANWGSYTAVDELIQSSSTDEEPLLVPSGDNSSPTLSAIWESASFDFTKTLKTASDGRIHQTPLQLNNLIPLYGVTNPIQGVQFDGNRYFYAGTVNMLRAFAKIEVVQSDNSIDIDEVRVRRYCKTGFHLPYSYRTQDAYLKGYYKGDYSLLPHVLDGNSAIADDVIYFNMAETYRWYVYVPEFTNKGKTDSYQSSIEIKFHDYDHYETLHFSKYVVPEGYDISVRGDDFDLLRNNIYRYYIYKDLQVVVDVIPYIGVDLNPEFGFDDLLPRPPTEGDVPPWVVVDPDD